MDLLDASQILMSVKRCLFTIMETEAVALGIDVEACADYSQHQAKSTLKPSSIRRQLQPQKDNELFSEKLDDNELDELTRKNIEDTYKKPWNRLSDKQKIVCIEKFAQNLATDADQKFTLHEFLIDAILHQKKLKHNQIDYDQQQGCIQGIARLAFKDNNWQLLPSPAEAGKHPAEAGKKKKQPRQIKTLLSKMK